VNVNSQTPPKAPPRENKFQSVTDTCAFSHFYSIAFTFLQAIYFETLSSTMMSRSRPDQKAAMQELKSHLLVLGTWLVIVRATPYVLQALQRSD